MSLQNISHACQTLVAGEGLQLNLEDVGLIVVDFLQVVIEALLTQLADGAGGGNIHHDDVGSLANLLDDVLCGLIAHVVVIAGDLVDALAVHIHIEVDHGDAHVDDALQSGLHAGPLGPGDDNGGAPCYQIIQSGGHGSGVLGSGNHVLDAVVLAVLLSIVSNTGDPAVGDIGSSDTDLDLLGSGGGSLSCSGSLGSGRSLSSGSLGGSGGRRTAAGSQRQHHCQSQKHSSELFHF